MSPKKSFSPFSPKMLLFARKLLNGKIFKTSFLIKKDYTRIYFCRQKPLRFKRGLSSSGMRSFSSLTNFLFPIFQGRKVPSGGRNSENKRNSPTWIIRRRNQKYFEKFANRNGSNN